ncbi:MAG: NAD-dependent epimerase/dehydratase family protein [Candidatus Micrarchaeota archaeon]
MITGGAGFIGSALARRLLRGNSVVVFDNFSSGSPSNFPESKKLKSIRGDIRNSTALNRALRGAECDCVYHFAADPDVRGCTAHPRESFAINVAGTLNVLEACRKNDVRRLVFASSSVVYGDATRIPTPETAPLAPISVYGASKAAGEAYCAAFAETYGLRCVALRYANIFGPPSTHGVMCDFVSRLQCNPRRLEILGDGLQAKSYLYVDDALDATLLAARASKKPFDAFNVGSSKKTTVKEIAGLVSASLGVTPKYLFTGGKRGWKGDVRVMLLDTRKLRSLGWREKTRLRAGVRKYVSWLARE